MAVKTLVNITQDEVEYARLCSQIKSQLDYQSGMENARREGRAEGRQEGMKKGKAEGRAEGRVETARNFKALGIPADIIVKATGMSPEEIAKL